ncbi:hypothetical protein A1O3_03053 [Capronia epimyces CBS 606.96]|uniref:Uncharacterized protein n=1 Tax=Capronia epimyces CBS 606.96 TaxID=1182542 RepID=W9YL75_9EURO|nr:uncharacterized protein A1O3_03053 [Capronia epimyces CBS 606.96]EXJ89986.1 hypothetical protein A1O3_03053 [Capronia epimyces CBS 606.96]
MSTNPFRQTNRSSLKGPGGSNIPHAPSPDPRGTSSTPLTVDTRVPSVSQKHVNFASPPAIPISPVSYPPSPESTRQDFSSPFPSPGANIPPATDYIQALRKDPFAEEASDLEDDALIGVALENARANTAITDSASASISYTSDNSKQDAVRDTLSRFASTPRRLPGNQASAVKEHSGRPTMDVDAFKRLLLTGEPGAPSFVVRDTVVQSIHTGPVQTVSDSGSSADTASISQHSIFETVAPPPNGSPRTSDDLDAHEADEQRASLGTASEGRKKPAPPKSRRGKPLRDSWGEQAPTATFDSFINSLALPDSRDISAEMSGPKSPPADGSPANERVAKTGGIEAHKRVPPAPPLARRKSQQAPRKPNLTRNSSSRHSVLSDIEVPSSPADLTSTPRIPPPPPLRRSTGTGERRPSLENDPPAPIAETAGAIHELYHGEVAAPESSFGLSNTTPVVTKRMSQMHPPPVPPPRRGRGSSRGSAETQRPSMAVLGMTEHGRSDSTARSSMETRDILADLAALQREVDAARASAQGG